MALSRDLRRTKVRAHTLVIGFALSLINCYWVIQMEMVWENGIPTRISLFFNAILTLALLVFVNSLLKKIWRAIALKQSELLVIYLMICLASALAGTDMLQTLIPIMGHATWFATPENEWPELFGNYLPTWLTVGEEDVLKGFYEGSSSLYIYRNIRAWLIPVLAWSSFTLVLLLVMLCTNIFVRKQWMEREKLTYPIIQLPLAMTSEDKASSLYRNKLFWIGFGVAGGFDLINGLSRIYPVIPSIPIWATNLGSLFTRKPLNAIGWTPVGLHPFVIGLGFLIPLDLSFSCWFFYILWKAQNVLGSIVGFSSLPGFPYPDEQSFAAYVGIGFFVLWMSHRHLFQVLKKAVGAKSHQKDSREYIGYRAALFGIIGGMIFLILFCRFAGMGVWISVAFFVPYFALSIAITRMRAELGPPMHDLHYADPGRMIVSALSPRRLGVANLNMFSLMYWFTRSYRGHPMAHQLEGFKMAERTKMDSRRMMLAMAIASIAGTIGGFWIMVHLSYKLGLSVGCHGYTANFGKETFSRLHGWLNNPAYTDYPSLIFMGIGFVFALILMVMRMKFFWWPLHPVGYAISGSWSMNLIWFQMFISSLVKWIILRHGGLKHYRQAIPFFLGLILGEFVVGGAFPILGLIWQTPVYRIW
ncbi:DUF6785 family protein [Candidatus Poribacteria bacterium]